MAIGHMTKVIHHLRKLARAPDGATLTDGELLECFVSRREEAALEALVVQHGPMVWGVCRRLLNHHDAEDAFQATFLVLVRKAASIVPRDMVGNWLYGVARQAALNVRTRLAKQRAREVQVTEMPELAVTEGNLWPHLQPLLDQELSRLPDKYRVAIVLCDLESKSRKEAARQLGLPEGTVASRLARGRVMLAKRLARRGLSVSAGMLAAVLSQKAAWAAAPSVMASTIKTVTLLAAGQPAATRLISAKVAALTQGLLQTLLFNKCKKVMVVLLLLAGVLGGSLIAVTADKPGQVGAKTVPSSPVAGQNQDRLAAQEAAFLPAEPELGERAMAVQYSPEGQWLATAEIDGTVRLWNAKTQRPGPVLRGRGKMVRSIPFTPDSATLVAGCDDNKIYVWDVGTGKLRATLAGHRAGVFSVAMASDGKTLATCAVNLTPRGQAPPSELKIWDLQRGKLLRDIECRDEHACGGANGMAFAPGTGLLAVTCYGQFRGIKVWNTTTGKEVKRFPHEGGFPLAVALSPDGKWLAGGGGDAIQGQIVGNLLVWDWESGKLRATLAAKCAGYVRALAFSRDSTRLVAGSEGPPLRRQNVTWVSSLVHCWETKHWTPLWMVQGFFGPVWSLDMAPDGQSVVSSDGSGTSVIDAVLGRVLGYRMITADKVETEQFGNARAVEQPDWADRVVDAVNLQSRVYEQLVNGQDSFFYRGDAGALNEALRRYAAVKDKARPLILLPGSGHTRTLAGKSVAFDWQLDVPGGLSKTLSAKKHAVMTVYLSVPKPRPVERSQLEKWLRDLDDDLFKRRQAAEQELQKVGNDAKPFLRAALQGRPKLETRRRIEALLAKLPSFDIGDLEIPKGIELLSVDDLIAQGIKALQDADRNVRGQALQELSGLARFSDKVVPALVEVFTKDQDAHIRQIAAACLARTGVKAKVAVPILKKSLGDPDLNVRHTCQDALARIENAKDASNQEEQCGKEHAIMKEIREFKKVTGGKK